MDIKIRIKKDKRKKIEEKEVVKIIQKIFVE